MIDLATTSQVTYNAGAAQYKTISAQGLSKTAGNGDQQISFSGDYVSLSLFNIEASATYSSNGEIQSKADAAYDLLRNYVLNIFEKQGLNLTISTGEQDIDLREISQEDAQALIADDGYFGVDQTSDRIVDFAIGASGNDPSRLETILSGVEQGFNDALEAFGGWLPDISYATYDAVLEKLNQWSENTQTG